MVSTTASRPLAATPAGPVRCWHCGGALLDLGPVWVHEDTGVTGCPPGTACRECCAHEPTCDRAPWVGDRYLCADCTHPDDQCGYYDQQARRFCWLPAGHDPEHVAPPGDDFPPF